jgi:hypothetical protein
VIVAVALFVLPHSALANACQSNVSSGNWGTAGTWTNCGGTTPQTTDTVQILAGHTITIDASARTVAGLQIDSTGTLANGGFLLTVTGTGTGVSGFTVNGTLSGTGGTTLSGSGATIDGVGNISATGTVTLSNTKTIASTAALSFAGTITISSGVTITNNGAVTTTGTGGITGGNASSTWTQGASATLNFGGSTTSLLSTGTLTATATGNTVNYNQSGNQTCKTTTYYNLKFSGSGTKTCAATTVSGNLTMSGGTWTTGTTALTVSGTTTIDGGTLALSGGTGNKIFVGLVTVSGGTLNGSATVNFFRGGITHTSGTVALTGTATFNTNSQVLTGTMSFSVVTVTGVTVTNNGTVTIASTFSGTGGWTQGMDSVLNLGGSTTNAAAITTLDASTNANTINYNRSGTQTCKVVVYQDLSFSGTSAKTCTATTINGTLTMGGTATWTMTVAAVVSGNLVISGGTLTTGGVTFSVTGTTTVSSGTLSLTNNTGAKTFTGLVTVSGGTLSGASTASVFQGGITQTSGTVSITGTATFTTNNQDLNGTMAIATVTVTTVTVSNKGTLSISTGLSGTGGLTNDTTGTVNYTVSAAPTITTLTSSAIGSTFNYSGAAQTCKVVTYYNLGLTGSGAKTCAVTTVDGNLTTSGTATWTTSASVVIGGNLVSGGGTSITTGSFDFTVTGTSSLAGTLNLNGTGNKTLIDLITVTTGGVISGNSTNINFQGGLTNSGGSASFNGSVTCSTNSQAFSGTISFQPLIVSGGITVTNNGTLTVQSGLSGTGTFVQGASSTLNTASSVTVTTFTATATGNTVHFNSTTGGQTMPASTYYNLQITKSAQTATLGGDITVLGNLTITSGTLDTAAGQNYDITLAGNWSNSGTYTARSGVVTLNGSSTQILSGTMTGGSAFSTLVITNNSGVDDPACGTSFTPGVIFSAAATATNYTITTGSVRVQYLSGATYTFTNINWNGQASGTPIFFRNSNLASSTWLLNVSGTQTDVSYVNVSQSDASAGSTIVANATNTDCNNNTNWTFSSGTLSLDIVDSGGSTVLSPSVVLSTLGFSFSSQTSTGTLGTSSQKIRISNGTATPTWTLTIAASSSTAVWDGVAADYDFNDPTASVGDGADADSFGGRLTINPGAATITPGSGCSTTGLTLGSSTGFSEGVIDTITLLTAGSSADTACSWDITGIGVSQSVPAEQPAGSDYDLNLTMTVTAS